jgi:hypothetical protein
VTDRRAFRLFGEPTLVQSPFDRRPHPVSCGPVSCIGGLGVVRAERRAGDAGRPGDPAGGRQPEGLRLVVEVPAFYTAFQAYPRILSSITEVLGFGLMVSGVFLLVAISSAITAVRTRNAPLRNREVAGLVIGLAFGVFYMLGMFMAMG